MRPIPAVGQTIFIWPRSTPYFPMNDDRPKQDDSDQRCGNLLRKAGMTLPVSDEDIDKRPKESRPK
jgi:hypothetical protein